MALGVRSARPDDDDPEVAGDPPPRAFQRLGRYRLVSRIGEGGMGEVYLALDPQGRAVAVKVLRDHIAYDADARARLGRELDTLSRVRHERVAAVIDADIHGPRPYLVTEYVPGPALDVVVAEQGPVAGLELVRIGRGLVAAVEAIHAAGVVHRDLKPANVLLKDGVEPVLIDFGIAHAADDIRLTSTGLVMGTPGYLSPEVIEGAPVTEATDWWGWAATMAFAATGRPPFGRGPMDVVLSRVRRGEFDLAGLDPRLEPLLAAALSPRPADRPPAGMVVAALERYAAGPPSVPFLRVVPGTGRPGSGPPAGSAPTEAVQARHTEVLRQSEPPRPGRWATSQPAPPWTAQQEWSGPAEVLRPEEAAEPPEWAAPIRPAGPGEADPRIGRADRTGTLAALVAALGALAAVLPVVAVLVAVAWSWAARVSDRSVTALVVRRHTHGRRRSDVPVALALSPWHVVSAAVRSAVALLLPLLVGLVTAFSVALLLSTVTGDRTGPGTSVALAAGGVIGTLMAWWGPGGASLRRGSRSLARGIARPGLTSDVVVGVLVALAAACAVWALLRAGVPLWWPLRSAPELLGSSLP